MSLSAIFRTPVAPPHIQHHSLGFMLDIDEKPVLVIAGFPVLENKVSCKPADANLYMLSLKHMEVISHNFSLCHSDMCIFNGSEDAIKMQDSLGYICYQMHRRLIRLEQGHDNPNYRKPIDLKKWTDTITDAVNVQETRNSPFKLPEHRDLPLVQPYDRTRHPSMLTKLELKAA